MNHENHLKQMLVAGAAVAAGLLIFGVPPGSALRVAAVVACPLGMVAMMLLMNRHVGAHPHTGRQSDPLPPPGPWPDAPPTLGSGPHPSGQQHERR